MIAGDIVSKLEMKTKMETEIRMEALCLALGMSDVDGDVYDDGDDDEMMLLSMPDAHVVSFSILADEVFACSTRYYCIIAEIEQWVDLNTNLMVPVMVHCVWPLN